MEITSILSILLFITVQKKNEEISNKSIKQIFL